MPRPSTMRCWSIRAWRRWCRPWADRQGGGGADPLPPGRSRRRRWLRTLAAGLLILLLVGLSSGAWAAAATASPEPARLWRFAWGDSPPYEQQERRQLLGTDVVGVDVQLLRTVVEQELGGRLQPMATPLPIAQQIAAIASGEADVITDMEGRHEQRRFARFSDPYRQVEMVVTAPERDRQGWLRRRNEVQLLAALRRSPARLGVIEGWSYGPRLDPWLATLGAGGRRRVYRSPAALAEAVRLGEVELGLGERLSLATAIWSRNPSGLGRQVAIAAEPFRLEASRFMFSARTVSEPELAAFNAALASVRRSGTYQRIVRTALFPVLLAFSAGQWWFYPLELLGVFAAALTGAVLAVRAGLSLVGLVIVAMVTSVGGGVLRDALINRPVPSVMQSPVYLGLVYAAVAAVLAMALLAGDRLRSPRLDRWLDGLDAIGIAAFTVTGVLIALRMQAEPLLLWGPLLSVLTACGGLLAREVILGRGDPLLRPGVLYIEIVFVGSLLLSLFLTTYSGQSTYRLRDIESAVLLTMLAVVALRLAALRWRWRLPALLPGDVRD